jgi:hypothetical protein
LGGEGRRFMQKRYSLGFLSNKWLNFAGVKQPSQQN